MRGQAGTLLSFADDAGDLVTSMLSLGCQVRVSSERDSNRAWGEAQRGLGP